jgi:hypothetical protein
MGPEAKNDCADEDQEQFTKLDWTGHPGDQALPATSKKEEVSSMQHQTVPPVQAS